MEDLIRYLRAAFASEYAFMLKAQNFHWNVESDDFVQLHELFGKIYNEVEDVLDDFAENIRKVKAFAPASFSAFTKLSAVSGVDQMPMDCHEMLQSLLTDSENMEQMFAIAYEKAEANKKFGLANFLADRQDAHAKHSWMLRMMLTPDTDESQ